MILLLPKYNDKNFPNEKLDFGSYLTISDFFDEIFWLLDNFCFFSIFFIFGLFF